MARQGYDLQLTRYDEKGWRATFYTTGMEHSPTSATGTGWERTPWRALQGAAARQLRDSRQGCDVRRADLLDQCKRDVRAPQVFRRDEGPILPEMFHARRHVSMRCESTRRPRKSESAE